MKGILVFYHNGSMCEVSILKQIQGGDGGVIWHVFSSSVSWQNVWTLLPLWLSHANNLEATVLIFRKKLQVLNIEACLPLNHFVRK